MRQLPRGPLEFRGPASKIAHTVSIRWRYFLEVIMKSGRKVGNTRSIRGEELFSREYSDFGSKVGKSETKLK